MSRSRIMHGFLGAVLCVASLPRLAGADEGEASREQLHATLWVQRAAEYRAIVAQTYRLAAERLHPAKQPGSAALEQSALDPVALAALPTAIILDLDETVLDNSFFQARLLRERRELSDEAWQAWVQESAATLLPGARAFLEEAQRLGHRVFYVTNRECPRAVPAGRDPCPAKTATQRNLTALGLPFAADPTSLLLRGERPQWVASSKSARRAWIGERYRIVALVGDDLNDFIDRREFIARRAELEPLFGTRWFLLPNPIYGSWERALSDPACTPAMASETCSAAKLARKYQLLEPQPAPLELPGGRAFDAQRRPARLRIASWNIEYLLEPDTYGALAAACIPAMTSVGGALRRIPCTIVPRLDRGPADFVALRAYAARLDADVVALQEVDGPAAAGQVFPGYEFCFSARPHVQKNGFAIRRGVPFRCEPEYLDLSLGDTQRRGVVITLFPGTPGELTLMNVHLKSGCPAGPLNDETNKDCTTLSQQLPQLEEWIDAQAAAGRRFGVLGDFNRRVSLERGSARDDQGRPVNLWAELDDGEPAGADLVDVSAGRRFRKCVANDPYDSYVDLVVLGRALARDVVRGSFTRVTYSLEDAERYKLSDHCPVGIDLRLP